jgi:hypothetical protein
MNKNMNMNKKGKPQETSSREFLCKAVNRIVGLCDFMQGYTQCHCLRMWLWKECASQLQSTVVTFFLNLGHD